MYFVAETTQVELKSGRVRAPAACAGFRHARFQHNLPACQRSGRSGSQQKVAALCAVPAPSRHDGIPARLAVSPRA